MSGSFHYKFILSTILSFFPVLMLAQTYKVDSLRKEFNKEILEKKKNEIALKICENYNSLSADSLLKYINACNKWPQGSLEFFKVSNFYCNYLFKAGKLEEAITLTDSLINIVSKEKEFDQVRLEIMSNHCMALIRNNQTKKAIEECFYLLQKAETLNDTLTVVRTFSLLGWANMELEQYHEATRWLNKGFNYTKNEKILKQVSSLFSNSASSYNNINKKDSALFFINLALKYSKETENLAIYANSLNIRAAIALRENDFKSAQADLEEALTVREKIGDPLYIISDMSQLSGYYAFINQPEKGIEIAQKGIAIARKTNNLSKLLLLYYGLADNYNVAKKKDEYAAALVTIIELKDSVYKNNSEEELASMQAKYELQKKENIIIQQKYDLIRNQYFTWVFGIVFFLAAILAYILYKNYQSRQKRKMTLAMEEQKRLSTEAVHAAEENERKRIAADLHDNLGSYAAAISANVKQLQEDDFHQKKTVTVQLEENAQSMVTQLSDTIWVLKNEYLPFTKLADRCKAWMIRLMKNYPSVKYHFSEDIKTDIEFTPSKILHIFLILKECINNALKHSNCTDLTIKFFSNEHLMIVIEDNGIGVNENFLSGRGSGIDNITLRAAECGWQVKWENASPGGTKVILRGNTTN
jgi:signal transduction histidine kinase